MGRLGSGVQFGVSFQIFALTAGWEMSWVGGRKLSGRGNCPGNTSRGEMSYSRDRILLTNEHAQAEVKSSVYFSDNDEGHRSVASVIFLVILAPSVNVRIYLLEVG